jgi:UDPglucose 6-dehydrogenase
MDYDFQIINTVMQVNEKQKTILGRKVRDIFGNDLGGRRFAIWGLAFKPETDDIREAPALELIQELLDSGADVTAFDPEAMENVKRIFGDKIAFAKDQYEAIEGADALIIVTEWSEFRNPNFERISQLLKHPMIFDGRNVYSLEKMQELGFYYESIGRKTVHENIRHTIDVPEGTVVRERGNLD